MASSMPLFPENAGEIASVLAAWKRIPQEAREAVRRRAVQDARERDAHLARMAWRRVRLGQVA